ncbi:MAG TPA: efflux RND transporter periplasmic adaptor subunit [Candidatus Sphingobacterium stercoripullorum]|nr:efflux RND transporter periplasmic adaptor subunit [Candidatus Sphingobacterium stercoripullorum]
MNISIKSYLSCALAVTLLAACGGDNQNSQSNSGGPMGSHAVSVTTEEAKLERVGGTRNYPATVVALNETEIRAEVNGYITGIFVSDGARVQKGQKLYEIDRIRYEADVEKAEANLRIAESNLLRIERDVERYRSLAEQDAIAKQTLDYAETDLSTQQAQVQANKAALVTAQTNLKRAVIIAPYAGVVGISQVREGALVSSGTTLINTISSIDPIAVEIQINEKEIDEFIALQNLGSSENIKVKLPNGLFYEQPGNLVTLDRAIDRNTGTLKARASFSNQTNRLIPGMNVNLVITTQSEEEQVTISQKSLIEQLGVYNVFVVNKDGQAEYREVATGPTLDDGRMVVLSGVEANEKVIVDGATRVSDGDLVSEPNEE